MMGMMMGPRMIGNGMGTIMHHVMMKGPGMMNHP
jgi:hypothetical protein